MRPPTGTRRLLRESTHDSLAAPPVTAGTAQRALAGHPPPQDAVTRRIRWRSRRKRVARARRPPCTVLPTVLGWRRPRIRLATRDPRAPRGGPCRGLASLLLVESPPRAGYPLDDELAPAAPKVTAFAADSTFGPTAPSARPRRPGSRAPCT